VPPHCDCWASHRTSLNACMRLYLYSGQYQLVCLYLHTQVKRVRIRNDEVLQRMGLTSLSHLLSCQCISVFGLVARLNDDTPANVALQLHINVPLNWPPDRTWHCPPCRPWNKWLNQLQNHFTHPVGHHWRAACCLLWTCWCIDVTALAGYVTMMMMK